MLNWFWTRVVINNNLVFSILIGNICNRYIISEYTTRAEEGDMGTLSVIYYSRVYG